MINGAGIVLVRKAWAKAVLLDVLCSSVPPDDVDVIAIKALEIAADGPWFAYVKFQPAMHQMGKVVTIAIPFSEIATIIQSEDVEPEKVIGFFKRDK